MKRAVFVGTGVASAAGCFAVENITIFCISQTFRMNIHQSHGFDDAV